MANLYPNSDGELDLGAATRDLDASSKITNEGSRRTTVARLTAAALLDIAGSLRALALESTLAVAQAFPGDETEEEPVEGGGAPPLDVTELAAGTPVRVNVATAGVGPRTGILDGRDGIDSGEPWVGVYWDDNPDAAAKVYAAHIEPYSPADEPAEDDSPEPPLSGDAPVVSDVPEVDEIADDFEDNEPDPIALLEARQEKASKKGKKK